MFERFRGVIFGPRGLIFISGLAASYILLGLITFFWPQQAGFGKFSVTASIVASVAMIVAGFSMPVLYTWARLRRSRYKDESDRSVESSIQAAERRMQQMIDVRLQKAAREKLDLDPTIARLLNDKIDVGLIAAADAALKKRVSSDAKISRTLDFMNEITLELKNRLEGPAARAEESAAWARRAAYLMAVLGLAAAFYRVHAFQIGSGGFINILAALDEKKLWPIIGAQAAPWVGFVLLAEFTALLFLRFSNQAIALQRYFTESLAQLRDRHLAMRFVIEFGTSEQIVDSAKRMIEASSRELKFLDDMKKNEGSLARVTTSLKEKAAPSRRSRSVSKEADA